jgi:hypothetical protein
MTYKKWEDIPKGVLFHTQRSAEGSGVLVDPSTWVEIPFDKDKVMFYKNASVAGIPTKLYTLPKQVEDTEETQLD